jgi:hypothetical protein
MSPTLVFAIVSSLERDCLEPPPLVLDVAGGIRLAAGQYGKIEWITLRWANRLLYRHFPVSLQINVDDTQIAPPS